MPQNKEDNNHNNKAGNKAHTPENIHIAQLAPAQQLQLWLRQEHLP